MSSSSSHRPSREGPLLVLALALVCAVCIPLWQMTAAKHGGNDWSRWTGERVARLFLGPAQIAGYCAFTWACFILLGRYLEVRRQRRAFGLDLLPTDTGVCILPEDARLLKRQVEQRAAAAGGPYLLAGMIRLALGKYAMSRSARDVNETVRTQADVDLGRMVSSMATVHYLAWAIPAIGFLGTVLGLAMTMSINPDQDVNAALGGAVIHLDVAFDSTLIALALSLLLMFPLHAVQRDEEALVIDCQQYCLEHLISRLYEVSPEHAADHGAAPVMAGPLPGDLSSPRR